MAQDLISDEGVILEQMGVPAPLIESNMAGAIASAEYDRQIATAKAYPRSISVAMKNIVSLATLDEETAAECIYNLKRSGKTIRGPSIRLAEIIAQQWGNCRDGAYVVNIDRVNKIITAEGAFHDLETNRGTRATIQRRISDSKGQLFSDDMITVTGNAACSIARRNAILAGVPKGIWRKAVEEAEKTIKGTTRTLTKRRDAAIAALGEYKLEPEKVFKLLGVAGVNDIDLDHLVTLRVHFTALKNGETTVEELLRGLEPEKATRVTAATATIKAPSVFDDDDLPSADAKPTTEIVGVGGMGAEPHSVGVVATPEPVPAQVEPQPEPAPAESADAEPAEGDLFGGVDDDIFTLAIDLIGDLKGARSAAEAERIYLDANETLEKLPPQLRAKVETAFQEASAKKKRRTA